MVLSQIKKDKNILLKLKKTNKELRQKNIIYENIELYSKEDNNDQHSLYIKNEDENPGELAFDGPVFFLVAFPGLPCRDTSNGHFSQNGDCHPGWSPDIRFPIHE